MRPCVFTKIDFIFKINRFYSNVYCPMFDNRPMKASSEMLSFVLDQRTPSNELDLVCVKRNLNLNAVTIEKLKTF